MGFNPFKIDKKLAKPLVKNSAALRNTQLAKMSGLTDKAKPKPAAAPRMMSGNTPPMQDPGVRRGVSGRLSASVMGSEDGRRAPSIAATRMSEGGKVSRTTTKKKK